MGQDEAVIVSIPNRRKFYGDIDEADYLYRKARYWDYGRSSRARASPFVDRLEKLLIRFPVSTNSARICEYRAFVSEFAGVWPVAIAQRVRAAAIMESIVVRRRPLSDIDVSTRMRQAGYPSSRDLVDCLDMLAVDYWHSHRYDDALLTLDRSRKLCRSLRIRFEGAAMRREIEADRRLAG